MKIIKLIIVSCFMLVVASQAMAETPTETMGKSVFEILAILDAGDSSDDKVWSKQREDVADVVDKRFDLPEMAKRALAKYWKRRTADEKAEFAKLFAELINNTYIERLRSFSGTKDGTKFEKEIIRGTKAVVSSSVWQDNKEISVVYKMYNKKGEWRVYDVVIEGVSLVRNYRSQFAQVIQKDGYEALVRKIQQKLSEPPVIGEHGTSGD